MKKETLIYCYGALQGVYWMHYGCIASFAAVFLLDQSFSSGGIGVLIALSSCLSVLFQPIIAAAADQGTQFSITQIFRILCLAAFAPLALLSFFDLPLAATALLYGMAVLFGLSMQPLLSALGMRRCSQGVSIFGILPTSSIEVTPVSRS